MRVYLGVHIGVYQPYYFLFIAYNFSPQCGQYVFAFSSSSEKPDANRPAGKANNPIPNIAEIEPNNFPIEVIGKMSP